MFHEISDNKGTYAISRANFERFLDYLNKEKNIVDFKTLIEEKNENNVVITFDDVYENVYQNGFDLLKEKSIPYYLFICNEFLNKDKYLKEDEIRIMLKDSKAILASHNIRHELSRFLDDEEFVKNIKESKKELEEKFAYKIDSFAFPYGSMYACSDNNIKEAKNVFDYVCTTYPIAYNEENENILPRININDETIEREMK